VLLVGLGLGALAGCGRDPAVVATYRGGVITRDELEHRVMALPEARRGPSEGEGLRAWNQRLARRMVLEKVLVPAERYVLREGTVIEPGPWRRLLVRALTEREGLRRVEVPEDSVMSFYERNWSRFFLPEGAAFQHVFLPFEPGTSPGDKAVVRARADSVHGLAVSGVDFADLVDRYSLSESRQWGGRVGVVFRGQLSPEFERVVFSLQVGEISDPVATEYGYHILKVVERRAEELKSVEEAAPVIKRELALAELATMKDVFFEQLDREFPVTVSEDVYYDSAEDSAVVLAVAGLTVTRAEVSVWLEQMRREPGDREELRALLQAVGREEQLYRRALSDGLSDDPFVVARYRASIGRAFVDSVLKQHVAALEIEEEVLRAHYDEQRMRFSEPKRWHAREIVITAGEDQAYETWQRARQVADRARRGEDFGELARRHSSAPSASRGGDLGELTLWDTARRGPEFQKSLFALAEEEVSDAVRADGGYIILKLERITEAEERSFEDVKDRVRVAYIQQNEVSLLKETGGRIAAEAGYRFVGERG
jgi:parvulin-like peptidyl-prolyl isomerase